MSLQILKQQKMGMSQLPSGTHMEANPPAFSAEHLCSNAHVHLKLVDVIQQNLQPLKGVGNAEK